MCVCMYVCMYVHMYVHLHIRMYVCMYICIYVVFLSCLCVFQYVCTCIYVCVWPSSSKSSKSLLKSYTIVLTLIYKTFLIILKDLLAM